MDFLCSQNTRLTYPTFRGIWGLIPPYGKYMKKEPILTMKSHKQAMLAAKATKVKPCPFTVIAPFPARRPPPSSQGLPTGALRPAGASARLSRGSPVLHHSAERLQQAGGTAEPRPLPGTAAGTPRWHRGEARPVGSPGRPSRDRAPRALRAAPAPCGRENTSASARAASDKYLIP